MTFDTTCFTKWHYSRSIYNMREFENPIEKRVRKHEFLNDLQIPQCYNISYHKWINSMNCILCFSLLHFSFG